jgi:hypothetical protein
MDESNLIAAIINWIPMVLIIGVWVYVTWYYRRGPYSEALKASIEALEVNKRMLDELQEIRKLLKERGSKE